MKLHIVLGILGLAALVPLASADFICTYAPDGDGAVTLNSPPVWDPPSYTLSADLTQHWWPGHMIGDFAEGASDSRTLLWVRNTVYNDGETPPLVWTDYHLNISMDHTFAITGAATLPDWTVQNITQPVQQGLEWTGTVDYLAGTPINIGDWGEFDVQLSFTGSIHYCVELIPTPEPTSLLLIVIGGLLLRGKR